MDAITIAMIVFACVGGALVGMMLRRSLCGHHLSDESKDMMTFGMGLVRLVAVDGPTRAQR